MRSERSERSGHCLSLHSQTSRPTARARRARASVIVRSTAVIRETQSGHGLVPAVSPVTILATTLAITDLPSPFPLPTSLRASLATARHRPHLRCALRRDSPSTPGSRPASPSSSGTVRACPCASRRRALRALCGCSPRTGGRGGTRILGSANGLRVVGFS